MQKQGSQFKIEVVSIVLYCIQL